MLKMLSITVGILENHRESVKEREAL